MEAVAVFLEMGGYAAFVWPAYAITAVVLTGLLLNSLRVLRNAERDVEALPKRGERRES